MTTQTTAYYYKYAQLIPIPTEHREATKHDNVAIAIADGYVRIRETDWGQVNFQGRNKTLVDRAIKLYCEQVRIPDHINVEWPGKYIENYQGG